MVVTNVIPQKEAQCYPIEIDDENGSGTLNLFTCQKNETLEYSLNHGIVITNILQELFPNLSLIQPLVAFSLIIAFLTLGSGYLDTVFSFGQGFLKFNLFLYSPSLGQIFLPAIILIKEFFHSLQLSKRIMPESEQMSLTWTTHKVSTVIQFVAGLVAFSLVYFVASSNPQGFMIILERMASACLNITNSIFLRTMIVVSL